MLVTTTATTSTTTAPLSTLPMSPSSSPETNSTPTFFKESVDSPDAAMQPFTPGQCLLCPHPSPSFNDSVIHMQKSHGLFIPHQQHLAVDLETLFRYLHLIIFGYRECIQCGTQRATVQAVQQHMAGKGHCKFDISEQASEFSEFYDFSRLEDDRDSDIEGENDERNQEKSVTSSSRKPLLADEDSIRLPSGKIISKKSSAQAEPSFTQVRRRARTLASKLDYSPVEPDDEEGSSKEGHNSDIGETRSLSKREKREKAMATYQLANMSANDRSGLMHLSTPQQRSMLATQHRQAEKVQKEERRRQSKIERKGNKNLYAYWATETPVYLCG
ncbi:C2H2 type zinc-finger-domain-containing protein [Talaromyces proteolyticus]|uniref:C2H2 type zinc-finger-domain-containing protein n=1 Tax=Talaromyces proteolyticus TaxID=1131652 RepID=A0AAD4KXL5_9EURO|nr:C2H2 type zinc-finger-domain-containing protein [Talaromyces proteolyticus]KAH8702166.1 C2H2 type zinc-finger-domain-containing protein [Talaromyces proteolyticus]